jgi:integrase
LFSSLNDLRIDTSLLICQVRAGETVTSARAMDEETLQKLHNFNLSFEEEEGPDSRKCKAERPENWAGHSIRVMLLLIYIIAFLCLLRFDEVLNIKWSWIQLETYKGRKRIKLSLPFRKTHQYGGKNVWIHLDLHLMSICPRHCTFLPV